MPEYVLPDLPYDHSALEPHISGRVMELHHDEHHQTYVTGQGYLAAGLVPLLLLDMWEHSFHLDHQNVKAYYVKADYVQAWWNVVDWSDVEQRTGRARTATSGLVVPA
ncbi:Fe-Mn family superoxide dismutase [Modestobacter excelsi]|uniref:Fe-Mn family superoxide dismutase n=1 Tax=Modestobacter excelsi TaxID=2213161 RepID=UPI00110CC677|nr:Fe-Mn family superoxide dismutase [Modestobacter excelsi]